MIPRENPKLERLIHQTLRELPARRAPRSLEGRVLAEIARRAALPWWRKSFAHWPMAARAVFLLLSAGLVKLALMATVWVMAGFDNLQFREAISTKFAWVEALGVVARTLIEAGNSSLQNLPALWLYGGIAVVGALYVTLFGLGAAAYRALYAHR